MAEFRAGAAARGGSPDWMHVNSLVAHARGELEREHYLRIVENVEHGAPSERT